MLLLQHRQGLGAPLEISMISAWLPGKKQRPSGRLQQGQDALTRILVWPPFPAVLLLEPCAPQDWRDPWLLAQPGPSW